MVSFFKRNSNSTVIPEWASFFNKKEYSLFIGEIDKYFKNLGIQYKIGDGQIDVDENEFGFKDLGLTNIAQVCKQQNLSYYSESITEHFDSLIRAKNFDTEFKRIADSFEEVKKYIGVRLYDYQYINHIGKENIIGKDFAGDIFSMIVFDFPDSVQSIKPEEISSWNKTTDELFDIGIKNMQEKYPLEITKEKFGQFSIMFVQGDHFFTPNVVFDIENRKELIGTKGSLIGLPHRHAAIIYPIENLEVIKAINDLIPTIYGMNQEGPGSLSNNLFWYKDKTFTDLRYKIDGDKMQFFPPNNFLEMLNELK
jgi:hypothetical protein